MRFSIRQYLIFDIRKTIFDPRTSNHRISNYRNISFTYPNETTPALQNINLQVKQGQHIALVGKTGAGKSTLVQLLLGFIQPTQGSINYQSPITNFLIPNSQSLISWVPQRPHLFHTTIAENIRLGKADATHEEVIQAAKAARLHEFIESLPEKYETIVGESGARLSSGQAQRLALARAFLKDAPILIFDEPTSALDPKLNPCSKNPPANSCKDAPSSPSPTVSTPSSKPTKSSSSTKARSSNKARTRTRCEERYVCEYGENLQTSRKSKVDDRKPTD
jgi:ABC-type Mn2+/Zn2+ transport system ATPase subunit